MWQSKITITIESIAPSIHKCVESVDWSIQTEKIWIVNRSLQFISRCCSRLMWWQSQNVCVSQLYGDRNVISLINLPNKRLRQPSTIIWISWFRFCVFFLFVRFHLLSLLSSMLSNVVRFSFSYFCYIFETDIIATSEREQK